MERGSNPSEFRTLHDPPDVPAAVGGYSQGVEVRHDARYLFISGQIPETPDGEVPSGFEEQCEAVWTNVRAVLASAGMKVEDLVKVTTFLTSPDQAEANARIRRSHLRDSRPALSVVVVRTLEPRWLLEIDAVAATA